MSHREVMETYGSDVYAGVHPDDIDYVRAEIAKMWDTGKLSVKHRLRRGDGGYIDVMVFGRLVRETPNDTYVNIYYADISEQVSIEDRRKELIENLPCGAAIYEISDTGIKALYVNSRYLMLVGHNAENLKGTTVIDLVHPDDRKILIKKLMSAIKEKREGTCDIRILCGDGEYRLFKATGNIEQNSDGKTMAYTTYTPISKEAVSYREMLPVALNAMMKASSDIAFVKDRNMKYVCCSSAFSRMVGYEDEKGVVGKTDYDMIDKDEADKYAEMDRQIVESGKPILNFIERIPSYDGVTRYATISKYLLYDSFGDVIGICGIGHDITNERTAYERLKLMTDSVFSGLATYEYCDSGIKIKYFNDNFCKILGYERNEYEQISSGNVRSTLYEEDWLIIHEQLKALIRDNSRIDCTCRIHRKDGSSGWLNIYGAISERREDALVINIIIYDVTESREKEERLRINDEEIRLAMSKIGKMIIIFDIPTRTLTMPRSYAEKHGLPEMITNVPESISAKGIIDSENETGYTDFYLNILNGEKQCTSESHIICPDGTWVWEHAESVTIFDSTGKPVKAIISVEDTTEQHNRSEEINTEMIAEAKRAHEYESLFFDAAAGRFAGIIKVNLTTGEAYRIDFENKTPHFKRVISKWDKLYKTFTDAIHPDDRNAVINKTLNGNIKDLPSGENVNFTYRSVILSEGYRWYTTTIRLSSEINSDNGETQHAATIFMVDVNDEIIERSKLKDLSEHDGLTDLFNRMKYDTMLETDYRDLKSCGVLFFDVNYLKVTNDTKGHDFGDGLLTLVADSIRSITNRRVHGYRYGGDEFIVVACNIEEREIDKLINMWHIRFDTLTCDRGIKGSVAVGKAWSAAPLSVANLVSDADKDMYHNKKIMKNKKRCGK